MSVQKTCPSRDKPVAWLSPLQRWQPRETLSDVAATQSQLAGPRASSPLAPTLGRSRFRLLKIVSSGAVLECPPARSLVLARLVSRLGSSCSSQCLVDIAAHEGCPPLVASSTVDCYRPYRRKTRFVSSLAVVDFVVAAPGGSQCDA